MHIWRRRFSHPRRRLVQQSDPVDWTMDSSNAVNIHRRRRFERLSAGNPRLRIPSMLPGSSHSRATVSTMDTVFASNDERGSRHPRTDREKPLDKRRQQAGHNSTVHKPVFSSEHSSATDTNRYQCPGSSGNILVDQKDLQTLGPGCMLNDTIIEAGLGFWLEDMRQENPKLASEVHVFSPFLYLMLNKTGKSMEDCYDGVRKWTSKIDIFEKSYLIIPIIEKSHWYLAIVYKPQYMLRSPPKNCTHVKEHDGEHAPADTYTDDEESERLSEETTFIFIFDSASASFGPLFESHAWAISKIESYLQLEAVNKKAHEIHQTNCAEGKEACVPCQPNAYDCGIFLLHFAKTFMSNPKRFYSVITRERRLGCDISIGERQAHWDTSRVTELRTSIASRIKGSPLVYSLSRCLR